MPLPSRDSDSQDPLKICFQQPDSDGDASGVLGPDKLVEQEDDAPKKKKKFMRSGKCLNCKEKGHLKMDCPKLTEERRKELQVGCLTC